MEVKHILEGWLELMKIRSKLNEVIKAKGYRKGWLANQVGVSATQVSLWCANKDGKIKSMPTVLNAMLLMKVLNCELDELFELVEE